MVENMSLQYHLSFSLLRSHKKAKGDIQSIGRIVLPQDSRGFPVSLWGMGTWMTCSNPMALMQMETIHFKTFRNAVFQTMKWYPGVPNSPAMAHLPWFLIYDGTEAHFITLMTQVLYKHHLGSHSFWCLVVVEKQCFPSISQNILNIADS